MHLAKHDQETMNSLSFFFSLLNFEFFDIIVVN
jgi:hypothetical protein